MKRSMKRILLGLMVCLLFVSSTYAYAVSESSKEAAYIKRYKLILQSMMKAMEGAPHTGDATLDFLYEMMPHHKAAVYMSENVLDYDPSPEVKQIAMSIVKEQTAGIAQMKELLARLSTTPLVDVTKEAEYLKGYANAYKQMITRMQDAKATGNINKDFLEEMIPHHEGAVEMATNILKYTSNKELGQIAQNIVSSQYTQLIQMKKLLQTFQ